MLTLSDYKTEQKTKENRKSEGGTTRNRIFDLLTNKYNFFTNSFLSDRRASRRETMSPPTVRTDQNRRSNTVVNKHFTTNETFFLKMLSSKSDSYESLPGLSSSSELITRRDDTSNNFC